MKQSEMKVKTKIYCENIEGGREYNRMGENENAKRCKRDGAVRAMERIKRQEGIWSKNIEDKKYGESWKGAPV